MATNYQEVHELSERNAYSSISIGYLPLRREAWLLLRPVHLHLLLLLVEEVLEEGQSRVQELAYIIAEGIVVLVLVYFLAEHFYGIEEGVEVQGIVLEVVFLQELLEDYLEVSLEVGAKLAEFGHFVQS